MVNNTFFTHFVNFRFSGKIALRLFFSDFLTNEINQLEKDE